VSHIRSAWRDSFAPRDRRPIYDWARANITLRSPLKPGLFEVLDSRQFLAPFDALADPGVREVNINAPVGDGKTLIADVWLPWTVQNFPASFLGVFNKDDVAKSHCETRTWRILESVPYIKALIDSMDKSATKTQEILFEDPIWIVGPSTRNLQHKRITYLWFDEAWQFPKGIIDEGKGRLATAIKLGLDKTLVTSQAGFKQARAADQTDEWWLQYDAGELNVWHVPCRDCGRLHIPPMYAQRTDSPERMGLVWDDHRDARGLWQIPRCLETVRYVCPSCAAVSPLSEQARVRSFWNRQGKHIRVGEEKRLKKSFTNNGLINWQWEILVDKCLTARNNALRGDRAGLILFRQKYLAEFFDNTELDDFERLEAVEITSEPTPEGFIEWICPVTKDLVLFKHRQLMFDVQMRELWALIDIWSDDGDDLTLHCEMVTTIAEIEELQARFLVPDDDVGFDINYHQRAAEMAIEACRHGHLEKNAKGVELWRQWMAYRGNKKLQFPHRVGTAKQPKIVMRPFSQDAERIDPTAGQRDREKIADMIVKFSNGSSRRKECRVINWSKPTISAIVDTRRDKHATATRSEIVKGAWNEIYSRHMYGEKMQTHQNKQKKDGLWSAKEYIVTEMVATGRHDLRDCKKMSVVHAMRKGRLNIAAEESSKEPEPAA